MAVYFDHRVETPENCEDPSQLTWHSALSILAVASRNSSTGGNVNIYLQQGEHVESCHVERPHRPTMLCWHPIKPVLAQGWENGEVLLLLHPSGDQNVLPSTHTAHITLLEWMGHQSESAGSQQFRHGGHPARARNVSPLQPTGGSGAVDADPAQHHPVPHRAAPGSQRRVSRMELNGI
uniref:IFT140 first beta-propeller domain-containing protein n=1 Tax=Hippocampus comes TaxID=109280 RepID=A0A3Q3D5C9_HIPCM